MRELDRPAIQTLQRHLASLTNPRLVTLDPRTLLPVPAPAPLRFAGRIDSSFHPLRLTLPTRGKLISTLSDRSPQIPLTTIVSYLGENGEAAQPDDLVTVFDLSDVFGAVVLALSEPGPDAVDMPMTQQGLAVSLNLDPDGVIEGSTDPHAVQMLGSDADDVIGHSFLEFVHPDDANELLRRFVELLTDTTASGVSRARISTAGGWRWCSVHAMLIPSREESTPFDGVRLVLIDVHREVDALDKLRYDATHDQLTGLHNRSSLTKCLEELAHDAEVPVAALFIDMDDFKRINDSYGHSAGDVYLREVASRIDERTRDSDYVVRFGGDEFVIVSLQPNGTSGALTLAHDLSRAIGAPLHMHGTVVNPRASIGIAVALAPFDPERLISDADAAMYEAKADRNKTVHLAEDSMRWRAARRLELESDVRRALAEGDIRLHYQAVSHLDSRTLVGAEGLIRWDHQGHGFVPPDEILSIINENGLLDEFTMSTLGQAAADLVRLRERSPLHDGVRFAINLSAAQLRLPNYAARHFEVLAQHGLTARDIVIEITETDPIGREDRAAGTISALADGGVMIALDDFGAGYSSLEYLTRMPLTWLKIDRSLITQISGSDVAAKVVEGIVSICNSLRIIVVAEGIETRQELDMCRSLGIDVGQGFFLDSPAVWDHLERFTPFGQADALHEPFPQGSSPQSQLLAPSARPSDDWQARRSPLPAPSGRR